MSFTFKQGANRNYVSSKIIYFIEYDEETYQLKIGFNNGFTGFFTGVPRELFNQFKNAQSKGSFFYDKLFNAGYKYYLDPN
ncbi:MAG: KTSC domain-containing protein [Bacteroidales bacterium]|nr:KTSC domain-containing protein [Bacteroidales bacterium]MCF8405598.1 KTSC domain-containing protein [Bacteroidales bacterium]